MLTCANGVVTQREVYFPNALRHCEDIYEEPPDRLEAAQARLVTYGAHVCGLMTTVLP